MKNLFTLFVALSLALFSVQAQNNALSFDGVDDYVAIPSIATNLSTFTIEAAINPVAIDASVSAAILNSETWGNNANGGTVHFQTENGKVTLAVSSLDITNGWPTLNVTPIIGQWQHVAVTYDVPNKSVKFYWNGRLVNTFIYASMPKAKIEAARIGSWVGSRFFNGKIDEVRVWNTVRTEAEIYANMKTSIANPSTTTGLIAYYQFNQGTANATNTDNTLTDASAPHINGTLTNFALTGTTSNWVAGLDATQIKDILLVSSNTATLNTANSNATTVTVNSNTTWKAVSSETWLTVTPDVATLGNATLNISAPAIAVGAADRTATITLSAAGMADVVINVTQRLPFKKVLVLGAEDEQSWLDDVKNNISNTNLFAVVDVLNANLSTPTLDQLKQYNSVFVFSDATFQDKVALGDVLADYVDYGGGVVCTTFATASITVGGRFNTANYWAIAPSSQKNGPQATLGTVHQPTSPLMDGVTSFNGGSSSYRSTSTDVATGATRIADWSDGVPLIATKTINGVNRVDLSFYPISNAIRSDFWDPTTDGIRIITNALLYASSTQDIVITTSDPTDITSISAIGAGNITQLGVTATIEHGVVWSTSLNPTIDLTTKTFEGIASATGEYTSTILGLSANTTYYARAYATNAFGTYYGKEVMFTTSKATVISDSNASTISIYPNPTTDVINLTSVEGVTSISITNLGGKTVWSGSAFEFPLNVSSYAKGIYMVNVVTEGGVKTEKVIVK